MHRHDRHELHDLKHRLEEIDNQLLSLKEIRKQLNYKKEKEIYDTELAPIKSIDERFKKSAQILDKLNEELDEKLGINKLKEERKEVKKLIIDKEIFLNLRASNLSYD